MACWCCLSWRTVASPLCLPATQAWTLTASSPYTLCSSPGWPAQLPYTALVVLLMVLVVLWMVLVIILMVIVVLLLVKVVLMMVIVVLLMLLVVLVIVLLALLVLPVLLLIHRPKKSH